jgi:hypothetical protein
MTVGDCRICRAAKLKTAHEVGTYVGPLQNTRYRKRIDNGEGSLLIMLLLFSEQPGSIFGVPEVPRGE